MYWTVAIPRRIFFGTNAATVPSLMLTGGAMDLPRRRFLHLAAGAASLPAFSRLTWAQSYPIRTVRIIVGFAAGTGADILARLDGAMAVGEVWPTICH